MPGCYLIGCLLGAWTLTQQLSLVEGQHMVAWCKCGTSWVAVGLSVIVVVLVPKPARLCHIMYMASLSPCQPYGMYISLVQSAVAAGCYMLVRSHVSK
jgi:hypothetical protein